MSNQVWRGCRRRGCIGDYFSTAGKSASGRDEPRVLSRCNVNASVATRKYHHTCARAVSSVLKRIGVAGNSPPPQVRFNCRVLYAWDPKIYSPQLRSARQSRLWSFERVVRTALITPPGLLPIKPRSKVECKLQYPPGEKSVRDRYTHGYVSLSVQVRKRRVLSMELRATPEAPFLADRLLGKRRLRGRKRKKTARAKSGKKCNLEFHVLDET